jgi:hypothetical protein
MAFSTPGHSLPQQTFLLRLNSPPGVGLNQLMGRELMTKANFSTLQILRCGKSSLPRISRISTNGFLIRAIRAIRGPFSSILVSLTLVSAEQSQSEVALPPGVKAVWDIAKAFRESTPTRERISINGLWRWQPAADSGVEPPTAAWG